MTDYTEQDLKDEYDICPGCGYLKNACTCAEEEEGED